MDPNHDEDADVVDSALVLAPPLKPNSGISNNTNMKKVPSIEALNSEMPCKGIRKAKGKVLLKTLLNRLRLRRCASVTISRPDPTYRVAYLGNVVTGWAKGDGCVEKPLATLWCNYTQSSRPDVRMQLTVSSAGLRATTKDHGLTEYWAHRLTTCAAPSHFPRLFCWVYRHEGRRLRHELRCHAVLCPTAALAIQIEQELKHALALALSEFKRDKLSRQNARLSLANSVYDNPTIPRRKILLSTGSHNYKPPLERSKSAPKLTSIEEIIEEEDEEEEDEHPEGRSFSGGVSRSRNIYRKILRHYDSTSALLDKRKNLVVLLRNHNNHNAVPERLSETSDGDDQENSTSNDLILEELVQNSMRNDLLESCERAWFNALGEKPDLIPPDSDEGSLSSGCESASTVTSDDQPPIYPASLPEENEDEIEQVVTGNNRKTDDDSTNNNIIDFKVGGSVLSRVRSFERITNTSFKFSSINNNNSNNTNNFTEEVSLIPVGESQSSDFSSLKVFKKRNLSTETSCSYNHNNVISIKYPTVDLGLGVGSVDERDGGSSEIGDDGSACSDESGYEEEEIPSSISNIVLV